MIDTDIGLHKSALDTPALLLDLDAFERNLARMQHMLAGTGVTLRPHVKAHKATPDIAHRQLQAGGVGVTCAKLAEAEVMAAAGIRDILIANQIVGPRKIARLMQLARQADVIVAVDNADNVAELAYAAQAHGVTLRVLVEVNIGHNRCGVEPGAPALTLARQVHAASGLVFAGIMGYDGHLTLKIDPREREPLAHKAAALLVEVRRCIEEAGLPVSIVSASGTFTFPYVAQHTGITEIQAGTYALMDTVFQAHGVAEFELTLSLLGTVTSRHARAGQPDLALMDIGRKSVDIFFGLPTAKSPGGVSVVSLSQEHGRLHLEDQARALKIGDRVELWVPDANGTINLYDHIHAMRGDVVEAVWPVTGRGMST
jgi:D-serine deaminase-like pyridoxal phosphate-dependent protein